MSFQVLAKKEIYKKWLEFERNRNLPKVVRIIPEPVKCTRNLTSNKERIGICTLAIC